jgi:hypothetical protein
MSRNGILICSAVLALAASINPSQDALAKGPPIIPAVAEIHTPSEGQLLGDVTVVEGSASCKRFDYWYLEYSASDDDQWWPVALFYRAVTDGLLAEWDTDDLEQGEYDLRLSVYSKQKLEASTTVTVNMTYGPCGDLNGDQSVDEEDTDHLAAWLWEEGPAPFQMRAADVDASGEVNSLDLAYLIDYLYHDGLVPICTVCGDADRDHDVDWHDLDYLIDWLFNEGPAPWPLQSVDMDGSGQVDPLDSEYLIDYLEGTGLPLVCHWVCGDVNADGVVDEDDVDYLAVWLWEGGPPPIPPESADVDCSGEVDTVDLDYLIQYVYHGGPAPCDCEHESR